MLELATIRYIEHVGMVSCFPTQFFSRTSQLTQIEDRLNFFHLTVARSYDWTMKFDILVFQLNTYSVGVKIFVIGWMICSRLEFCFAIVRRCDWKKLDGLSWLVTHQLFKLHLSTRSSPVSQWEELFSDGVFSHSCIPDTPFDSAKYFSEAD